MESYLSLPSKVNATEVTEPQNKNNFFPNKKTWEKNLTIKKKSNIIFIFIGKTCINFVFFLFILKIVEPPYFLPPLNFSLLILNE